jgi:Tfp pilus assembly protein PilF
MKRHLQESSTLLFYLVPVFLFLVPAPADAIVSPTREWGVVPQSMGGASVAAGASFQGISYNPANSGRLRTSRFTSTVNQLQQNAVTVSNGSLGLAFPFGQSVSGFALNRSSLNFGFNNFQTTAQGLTINYAENILYYNFSTWYENFSVGTNLKYFSTQSSIDEGQASGYGLDLGTIYTPVEYLNLGASITNVVGRRTWETQTKESLTKIFRTGSRFNINDNFLLETMGVYGDESGFRSVHSGIEYWLFRPEGRFGFALRGGLKRYLTESEQTNITVGLGLLSGNFKVDYSYQQQKNFNNQHFLGITIASQVPRRPSAPSRSNDKPAPKAKPITPDPKQTADTKPERDVSPDTETKQASVDWRPIHYQGIKNLNIGNYKTARKRFLTVLELNPGHPKTLLGLGVAEYKLDMTESAKARFKQIPDTNPNLNIAKEYLRDIQSSTNKTDTEPLTWKKRLKKAKTLFENEQYTKAREQLKSILNQKPKNVEILLLLARTEIQLANYQAAEERLLKILRIDPEHETATQLLLDL